MSKIILFFYILVGNKCLAFVVYLSELIQGQDPLASNGEVVD